MPIYFKSLHTSDAKYESQLFAKLWASSLTSITEITVKAYIRISERKEEMSDSSGRNLG